MLEKSLADAATIGRHDLQRAVEMLVQGQSFVCKLHGTISDVSSTVFTTAEYDALVRDAGTIALLERVVGTSSVMFIGSSQFSVNTGVRS